MSKPAPLLSICIPTYNRAHLLEIMLQALLPQVVEFANEVEVIVSDNASTDNTKEIVENAQKYGPVRYSANLSNIGVIANIVKCPLELAKGHYIWIMGDHNLMNIGSLKTLLTLIKQNQHLKIFYSNFNCANYPEHWPTVAISGFNGKFDYVSNEITYSRHVEQWHELIDHKTALCTQLYAHIILREVWIKYWTNKPIPATFENAEGTYPHTYMITKSIFNVPSFYIGIPLITIFNGAQHWGQSEARIKVYGSGLPDLISTFKQHGLNKHKIKKAVNWNLLQLNKALKSFFNDNTPQLLFPVIKSVSKNKFNCQITFSIISVYLKSKSFIFNKQINGIEEGVRKGYEYLFVNCRPARNWRQYIRRKQEK